MTITKEARDSIMARENALRAWMGKRNSYHPNELPAHINPPTNDERAQVELYDFIHYPPQSYFAYRTGTGPVTNWTGIPLCNNVIVGRHWRSSFGDRRYSFRCKGVNGLTYAGTAFVDAGDYVRMRAVKS